MQCVCNQDVAWRLVFSLFSMDSTIHIFDDFYPGSSLSFVQAWPGIGYKLPTVLAALSIIDCQTICNNLFVRLSSCGALFSHLYCSVHLAIIPYKLHAMTKKCPSLALVVFLHPYSIPLYVRLPFCTTYWSSKAWQMVEGIYVYRNHCCSTTYSLQE